MNQQAVIGSKRTSSSTVQTLKFHIAAESATPWPAMKISVVAKLADENIPLRQFQFQNGSLCLNGKSFKTDPIDALLLRSLLQQPAADDKSCLAGAREFAGILALLRQCSPAFTIDQEARLAGVRILATPAQPEMEILQAPPASDAETTLRIIVRARFRCPETNALLGWAVARTSTYWTFNKHISPPPELPGDAALKKLFEDSSDAARTFSGDEALDLLSRARAAEKEGLRLRLDEWLTKLRICRTLKPAVSVVPGENGSAQAEWHLEARDGQMPNEAPQKIAPLELLAAASDGKKFLQRGDVFVQVDREAVVSYRKQVESIAAFRKPGALARDEDIPELLGWANKARADVQTPWNVYVAEAVDGAHKVKDEPAALKLNLDVEEDDGEPWFTLNASFDHGGEQLSEAELRELVRKGQKWFRKGDTWIKIDAEALKKFDSNVERSGVRRHRGRARQFYYRFRPASRERVTDIFSLSGTIEHAERYRKFLDQLRGFERIQPLDSPKGMPLTLRPYQQQGFEWLVFLTKYGLNGILADDMGLGKTAQTIAAITRLKEENGAAPCLIVTPTSLVDNWRNECKKFSPSLRVMIYRGSPQRRDTLRREISDYDVVLGTYATVRNDASLLREIDWRYVILDEAHFIKNSAAATTKAVKTIPARHRLALTGTPVQNRLTELWSLFDFLMPDFLGRQMRFRDTYEDPIARMQSGRAETKEEHQNGEHAAEALRERIKPFVLRRLKTDVAGELPPKIENDVFCSLTPEQVAHYRAFADSAEAKEAVDEIVEKGANGACTAILAALTALRKICNHPDLMCLPKNAGRQHIARPLPGYENRSGKLEALGELLEQCREGGHRPLIFCQLTTMLDILGHFLQQQGMKFLRLDGETPGTERLGLVDKFNSDFSLNAFLISTRAGGAGLNLTGADTVIFYDHDWNPANDQQAQDRAYRIGQKRTVNVYRLICKGTLEEKILRRQALKKMLANSIIQHDVGGVKDLTREELLSLFTFSGEESAARC